MVAPKNKEMEAREAATLSMEQMRRHAPDAAGLMKTLGSESRLMVLCSLTEGEKSVGELNEMIPLSQSALSQQLARLRTQGLVETRRESQTIYYSLAKGPAEKVIYLLHDIYCAVPDPGDDQETRK